MTIPRSNTDEPQPPDSELVALAQAGNQQAYAQLVNRYYHMVYVVAYGYLKDHDAADDLAQETFIRAYAGRYAWGYIKPLSRLPK